MIFFFCKLHLPLPWFPKQKRKDASLLKMYITFHILNLVFLKLYYAKVKGTGIATASSPSVQAATVSINTTSIPLAQQLTIASNLSNTSTTVEDKNVSTKILDISPQTNDLRDLNTIQSLSFSASISGPAVSHPLPFPVIAAASPKSTSVGNVVASEESTVISPTTINQNSTDSINNNAHTSVDITASTAKKKTSRFIVKSVPKEVFIVILVYSAVLVP